MTTITLEFLGEQMVRMREDIASLRDDMTVLTGIAMRVDSSLQGLTVELRGVHRHQSRLARHDADIDARLDTIEARLTALEEA